MHTPFAFRWLIGKLWAALNAAGFQAAVVWHFWQLENEAGWWVPGFVWHALQAVGVPENTLFLWQDVQLADLWAPVSGKAVRLWSTDAPDHDFVVWHARQSVPNLPSCLSSAL